MSAINSFISIGSEIGTTDSSHSKRRENLSIPGDDNTIYGRIYNISKKKPKNVIPFRNH